MNSDTGAEQSLAADGAIACFSSSFCSFSLNADRAPQLKASVRRHTMSYTEDDLILFEPLFDPSQRDGTAYFEFHPAELPEENACWLPGSLLLRDAAFDFFVECFYRASKTFDYFSFVRFGSAEISRVSDDLTAYLAVLSGRTPSRTELFANYRLDFFG